MDPARKISQPGIFQLCPIGVTFTGIATAMASTTIRATCDGVTEAPFYIVATVAARAVA
jgi:hypothetical protein